MKSCYTTTKPSGSPCGVEVCVPWLSGHLLHVSCHPPMFIVHCSTQSSHTRLPQLTANYCMATLYWGLYLAFVFEPRKREEKAQALFAACQLLSTKHVRSANCPPGLCGGRRRCGRELNSDCFVMDRFLECSCIQFPCAAADEAAQTQTRHQMQVWGAWPDTQPIGRRFVIS